jgi:hypothetical protein
MRESAAVKARRLLVEGRVVITRVAGLDVDALVRGDTAGFHAVAHRRGLWICDCAAVGRSCSHIQAVQLVTAPGGTWIVDPQVMAAIGGSR